MIGATRSGSVGVNLSVIQFIHANLPFGGIGASGQGTAHGFAGFAAFSDTRPVLTNLASRPCRCCSHPTELRAARGGGVCAVVAAVRHRTKGAVGMACRDPWTCAARRRC